MNPLHSILLAAALALGSGAAAPPPAAADPPVRDLAGAFERIKELQGTWSVTGSPSTVTYTLTGNGSALVEEFRGRRGMASVYHLDGDRLVMTHYCSAGNQPRMEAAAWEPGKGRLRFRFLDVTNLSEPEAYHTRELEIRFHDRDRVQLRFNGIDHGEEAPVVHDLVRVAGEP